jgi:hypothetical protein
MYGLRKVGREACMWSSWVGEWAWLVLDLVMVLSHHMRHSTATPCTCSPTHASTCVVLCVPHSSLNSRYNHKLRWVHCPTCLTTPLSIEAVHHAIVYVLREDASGPYGWEGLESGYYTSAL